MGKTITTQFQSPNKVESSTAAPAVAVTPATGTLPQPRSLEQEASQLEDEEEDDDDEEAMSTANEFLAELQEDVLLQSLLHKRLREKKERVFYVEHRNGGKLRVVLPLDCQSISTFQEEAKKTGWIDTMLNSNDLVNGTLTYVAKKVPDQFALIGQKRKLSMHQVVLNTT